MRRIVGALIAAGILVGGAFAASAIGLTGSAGAATKGSGTASSAGSSGSSGSASSGTTSNAPGDPGTIAKEAIDALVADGTITAAQAKAAEDALAAAAPQHLQDRLDGVREPVSSVLASLVKKGTITEADSKAVTDRLRAWFRSHRPTGNTRPGPGARPSFRPGQDPLSLVLKGLVSKGTLTKAQSTAISNGLRASVENHRMSGPGGGPCGDSSRIADVLAPLVTDGRLTQAQATAIADAVAAAFRDAHPMPPMPMGMPPMPSA